MQDTKILIGIVSVVAVALTCAGTTQASIVMPEVVEFDLDRLIASSDKSGAREIPSGEEPDHRQPEPQLVTIAALMLAQQSGSTTSTSTGGTSPTLPSGSTFVASECVLIVSEDGAVTSLAAERALLLPDSPGNNIFHPPRDRS